MTMQEIPDYQPPRGGEWIRPDVVPYDCEPGVRDTSVLALLDAPAHRILARMADGHYTDFAVAEPPDGVTRAEDISRITSELLRILQQ